MSETYVENPHSTTVRGVFADLRERLERHETHPLGPTYTRMDFDYTQRDLDYSIAMLDGTSEDADFDPCDECEDKVLYIGQLKALLSKHKIDVPKAEYE